MGCCVGRGSRFAGAAVLSEFRLGAGMMEEILGKTSDELSVDWRSIRLLLLNVEFDADKKDIKKGVGSPALLLETILSVVFPRKKSSANDGGAGEGTKVTISRVLRRTLLINCPADTALAPTARVPRVGFPVTFLKVSFAELLLSH